jgi:hypothetical protein
MPDTPDELPDGLKYRVISGRLPDDYREIRAENREQFRRTSDQFSVEAVHVLAQQAYDFIHEDVAGMGLSVEDLQRIVTSVIVTHNTLTMMMVRAIRNPIPDAHQKVLSLVELGIDAAVHELYPLLNEQGDAS